MMSSTLHSPLHRIRTPLRTPQPSDEDPNAPSTAIDESCNFSMENTPSPTVAASNLCRRNDWYWRWILLSHFLSILNDKNFDCIPREGMEFSTLDDAWEFWRSYGGKMGFSVRKHYANKSKKDKIITSRRYLCNKSGHRGKDKRDHLTIEPRPDTRTDCAVRMGIILNRENNKYYVHDLVLEHNHILHSVDCTHMMISQRKLTNVQAFEVELADDSGLTQKSSYEFFGMQAGGRENLGFTILDQKNYLRKRRERQIKYGEVGNLLRYFQNKTLEDPLFFYAVQLDQLEQVTNIFWADARMRIDYAIFGDVMTFDTTFSTNKEYRPLGVFVGFNHFRGLTIFGAALLYDETIESFSWLFETFLEAHKHKHPKTIFTDQDIAMSKALSDVIPGTRHGLCTWHIMQNGIKHLGNLMKDGSSFLRDFKRTMFEYEDEFKFEEAWETMLAYYSVKENNWLQGIFKLKEKWAKCYMKTTMTLGMRSTQLSESLNSDLKDYLKSNMDLHNFFKQFERVVNGKRYNELKAEYNAKEKMPRVKVKSLPLLSQMSVIYTPLIFEKFQDKWEKSLLISVIRRNETSHFQEYLVASLVEEGEYTVKGNQVDQMVACTCMKYETFGILCSHALKVLDIMDVKLLPSTYIMKRWSRGAREGNLEAPNRVMQESKKMDITERYRELCPELVKIASRASESEEGYIYLKQEIKKLSKHLEELKNGLNDSSACSLGPIMSNENVDLGTTNNLAKAKGIKKKDSRKGGKRLKSWVEKQPRKKKKLSTSEPHSNDILIGEGFDNISLQDSGQFGSLALSIRPPSSSLSICSSINRDDTFFLKL